MIKWTGLAQWEFEFPFPGSLTSTFLSRCDVIRAPLARAAIHGQEHPPTRVANLHEPLDSAACRVRRAASRGAEREGNNLKNMFKTFVLKMAQSKAWLWL